MELVVLANILREPAVLAYHHRELAFLAKLLREPLVLTYHHRELAVLANLLREPAALTYHHREPVILANLWREVNFPISFGIKELAVPANVGQLRNEQETGTRR
jgi:hypothetical protein